MKTWLRFVARSARAEWALLRTERSVLAVLLFVPLAYPVLMSSLYARDQAVERPTLVVDADGSALSRRIVLDLDATQELQVTRRAATLDEGLAALEAQEAELLLFIPEDFSRRVKKGETAELRLWTSAANMYTYGLAYPAAYGVISQVNGELVARDLVRRGLPPAVAAARARPVLSAEHLLFHPTAGYGRYLVAGVLLVVIQQVVVLSVAFSAGARRERGPLDDSPYPVGYLAGIAAAHLPFYLAGILFSALLVLPAFHWAAASPGSTLVVLVALVLALLPVAVAVASFARDRAGAFQLIMFFSVPLFAASGFTWPSSQTPAYVAAVTAAFPATPALRALRIVATKGGTLADVTPYLAWLGAQLAVYSAVAVAVVHRSWTHLAGIRRVLGLGRRPRGSPYLERGNGIASHHPTDGGVACDEPSLDRRSVEVRVPYTIAVLAALGLVAGSAEAQEATPTGHASRQGGLEVGIGLGTSQAYGSLGGGEPTLNEWGGALDLTLGKRLDPHWTLGAYGTLSSHAAFALEGAAWAVSGGLQATYRLSPDAALGPWASVGAGVRRMSEPHDGTRDAYLGFDVLRVQVGLEPATSGSFSLSPVLGATLVTYPWKDSASGSGLDSIHDRDTSVQVFAGFAGHFAL